MFEAVRGLIYGYYFSTAYPHVQFLDNIDNGLSKGKEEDKWCRVASIIFFVNGEFTEDLFLSSLNGGGMDIFWNQTV